MLDVIKPCLRAIKYGYMRRQAERMARRSSRFDGKPLDAPVVFLIGCGRSGTTILGQIFAVHPQVHYLFEPYHLWAAIDPVTDCINLYHRRPGQCLMDAVDCTDEASTRFLRLMRRQIDRAHRQVLVEKTPLNTMRIGYLDALAPTARFVYIVRDGVDVCRSIARLASANAYKIAGKPTLNQWWGVDDAKWRTLLQQGTQAGYFPDEAPHLNGHLQQAAYEWLVCHLEVDRWRDRLGDRLCEMRYVDLIDDPRAVVAQVASTCSLPVPVDWLDAAAKLVRQPHLGGDEKVQLPSGMCEAFNTLQQRFGFPNRAIPTNVTIETD